MFLIFIFILSTHSKFHANEVRDLHNAVCQGVITPNNCNQITTFNILEASRCVFFRSDCVNLSLSLSLVVISMFSMPVVYEKYQVIEFHYIGSRHYSCSVK